MDIDVIASKQDFKYGVRNIEDIRKLCTDITFKYHSRVTDDDLEYLRELRHGIDKSVFDNTDFFYLSKEELKEIDRATGLDTMLGRVIFPVKECSGTVMGFVGYMKDGQPKYLDSATYGYKAKFSTCYGMEKLPEYLLNKKPILLTEGLIDCLCLRYLGFNSLALLGSYINKTLIALFKDKRCLYIADNDETGYDIVRKNITKRLPLCDSYMYKEVKDTNDALIKYGAEELKASLTKCVYELAHIDDIIGVII